MLPRVCLEPVLILDLAGKNQRESTSFSVVNGLLIESDTEAMRKDYSSDLTDSQWQNVKAVQHLLDPSPTAFIRTIRLEQAALLRDERGTVSEVAYAMGFKSISHFSQTFRKQYGVNSSEYLGVATS